MDHDAAAAPNPAIRIQRLSKHYGSVQALTELDLEVQAGEIFGFLGPNGAGKSTTIRTLLGYLHPTSGSATVLDLDIVVDSVAIRRRVGYLPGGISLYDSLSGEDALDYLNDLQGRPPVRREDLCERLQMPPSVLKRKVRDYSRGMRQKLGVIQALQHVDELLARRKRTIHLRWREGVPDLSSVPGLADIKIEGDRLSATLLGEVAPFVRAVASPLLVDLTIEPARLEEAFLEFYAEDEPAEEVRQ